MREELEKLKVENTALKEQLEKVKAEKRAFKERVQHAGAAQRGLLCADAAPSVLETYQRPRPMCV